MSIKSARVNQTYYSSFLHLYNEANYYILEQWALLFCPRLTWTADFFLDHVPNPAKVLVFLEELGLPYQSSFVKLEDLKKKPFEDINPNGRLPGTFYETQYFVFLSVQSQCSPRRSRVCSDH